MKGWKAWLIFVLTMAGFILAARCVRAERTNSPTLDTSQGVASVWEAVRNLERRLLSHTHDGTDGSSTLPSAAAATSFDVDVGTVTNHLSAGSLGVSGNAAFGGTIQENGNRVFSRASMFESSTYTISIASHIYAAHGLGHVPTLWVVLIRCLSDDAGYTANDEIQWPIFGHANQYSTENNNETMWYANSTNIGFVTSDDGTCQVRNPSNGARSVIDNSKWRIVFRAWY